ncbi:ketopantoate reductase family protein [Desulfopila sp. IMCC35006]|uniref:ketopantoate reductase family protein n=1 Tax=Desulfopila sp. IMCC35006 TaxID=2569542 RepID=UPI0010AD4AB8|nr:ketopantoate reductase family protein [Desulfopila sp. IMCC35006]TKB25224.1 ketopantoate reductase family protein [Desulfopila sp. IMCC35006]
MQTNKIKTIAIVGAGAMGAAYASMFADAGNFSLFFLASGDRYQRLLKKPLQVNGKAYAIAVVQPQDIKEPVDLVLVALKHHHLLEALPTLQAAVGPKTTILSVMNGLESEQIIGAACGMDKMVYAIAVGIDAVREGDHFSYARPGKIIFGAGPQATDASRVSRLQDALRRAAIPHEVPADMMRVMWWKFMINVGINQASAVLRAPYGFFHGSEDARALMLLLMQEVIVLAGKVSVNLAEKDLDEWSLVLATLAPEGKTSMLQDIEAGRKTEVEIFAGKVVSMGNEHGVPTPVNQTILHIIRAMEERKRIDPVETQQT